MIVSTRVSAGNIPRRRGRVKVAADFTLLTAAVNLAWFGVLGLDRQAARRTISTA